MLTYFRSKNRKIRRPKIIFFRNLSQHTWKPLPAHRLRTTGLRYTLLDQSLPTSEFEWLCMDVDGFKIINVYKPPSTQLRSLDLPMLPHPCLYAADFNCRHADWGCDNNSPDGECSVDWASINCPALLYNVKNAASFYSGSWNTGTNPDLAFASVGPNSCLPDRRVLEKFPRSQHRPLLITPSRFARQCQACLLSDGTSARPNKSLHCFDE